MFLDTRNQMKQDFKYKEWFLWKNNDILSDFNVKKYMSMSVGPEAQMLAHT